MIFKYDPETYSLYIHLNRSRSVKTIRVSAHIQIDIGKNGNTGTFIQTLEEGMTKYLKIVYAHS